MPPPCGVKATACPFSSGQSDSPAHLELDRSSSDTTIVVADMLKLVSLNASHKRGHHESGAKYAVHFILKAMLKEDGGVCNDKELAEALVEFERRVGSPS